MTPSCVLLFMTRLRLVAVLLALQSLIPMGCCCCPLPNVPKPLPPKPADIPVVQNPDKKDAHDRGQKDRDDNPLPVVAQNGRRYALLVGVTQYKPESVGLEDLFYPDEDVNALAEVLCTKGYRRDDVVVLNSSLGKVKNHLLPTVANFWTALKGLVSKCGSEDVLFVALSGHGHQEKKGPPFFCPYRANVDVPNTLVSIDRVTEEMSKASGMKFLLVDACRNSPGARTVKRVSGDGFETTASPQPAGGFVTYFSCSEGEQSWELDELRHGLFFDLVIKGLSGGANPYQDGIILWSDLVSYVERNLNFYADSARIYADKSQPRKRQTPHIKGDTTKHFPLVQFAAAKNAPAPAVKLRDSELMIEDFARTEIGNLPSGWNGEGFVRHFDEQRKRACLEVIKKDGIHWLRPPSFPRLRGDFTVEVEFLLNAQRGYPSNDNVSPHTLYLTLEGEEGTTVPIWIDHKGFVGLPGTQKRQTEQFKQFQINRLRLVRDGDSYTVFLNDGQAQSVRLPYTSAIETIRIGLVGGVPFLRKGDDFPARLYSMKVAMLQPRNGAGAPVGAAPDFGKVAFNEDFTKSPVGATLPTGWTGDGFSLISDERNQRRCLEVNKSDAEVFWLTLPSIAAAAGDGRDFFVELDFLLNGHRGYPSDDGKPGHQLQLRFEGAQAKPLNLMIDHEGKGTVDGVPIPKSQTFMGFRPNCLRVIRKGDAIRVVINDTEVAAIPRPAAAFEKLHVGLTGGIPYLRQGEDFNARLYRVKVVSLPGQAAQIARFNGLFQDFRLARSKQVVGRNLSTVTRFHDRVLWPPRLELQDIEQLNGVIDTPWAIPGAFILDCEFWLGSRECGITLQLPGKKSTLLVDVGPGPKANSMYMGVQGVRQLQPANIEALLSVNQEKLNRLIVERGASAYKFTLNDAQVGGLVPIAFADGPFEAVNIRMWVKDKRQPSPQLHRIVVTLPDAPTGNPVVGPGK